MRRVLVAVGVVLVAAALVVMASMDAQLRFVLFGFPLTQQGSVPQTSSALVLQTAYMRVIPYLMGAGGLAFIILGSTLSPRAKEKKETDVQAPSQPPPWEHSDIPGVKMEESNP